jgi:hypothetical protein
MSVILQIQSKHNGNSVRIWKTRLKAQNTELSEKKEAEEK